jgi:hypothetical protein
MLVEPGVYKWQWWITERMMFTIMLANELWSNNLANGERKYSLFNVGWFERDDAPGVRIYSLIFFWLSIRLGIRKGK